MLPAPALAKSEEADGPFRLRRNLRLLFFILPPVCKPKENLKAKIYVIDVFNRRHKVGKVTFISHENPQFPL